jgi:hypothetical protein
MGGNRRNAVSFLHQHLSTVERGALGTLATGGSVAMSFLSQFELYLRIGGLLIGLAIGVITLMSVWRDFRRKK